LTVRSLGAYHPAFIIGPFIFMVLLAAFPRPAQSADNIAPRPTVLHVGDSFVRAGLAQALKPRFEAFGVKYVSIAQTSAYIPTLFRDINFSKLRHVYHPALVIVTLGANEIAISDPEQRVGAIRRLVKSIGDVPCIWTLPPRWNHQGGALLRVIEREAIPCRVFDPSSFAAQVDRARDGIHPSASGGAYWAKMLWSWLGAVEPS